MKDEIIYMSGKRYIRMGDQIQKFEVLTDQELVDAGDIVTVSITRNGVLFKPEYKFQLVGVNPELNEELPKVSVVSPLGKTVYAQKVNHVGSYTVHENTFEVKILDKQRENPTDEKGPRISLSRH